MDLRATPPDTADSLPLEAAPTCTGPTFTPTGDPSPRAGPDATSEVSNGVASDGGQDARPHIVDDLALLDEHALRQLLLTQPVIEQAKGLLVGCYRLEADQAFALLRHWSSRSHVKIRDIAAQLVHAAARPGPAPFHATDASVHLRADDR